MSNQAKSAIALAILLCTTYVAIRFVLPLFTPFVIALFIAIMIDPLVSFIERKSKMPRGWAVLLVLVVVGLILGLVIAFGIGEIAAEAEQLSENMGSLSIAFSRAVDNVVSEVASVFEQLPGPLADAIKSNEGRVFSLVATIVSKVTDFLRGLPQFTVVTLLSVISTFFIARDKADISEAVIEAMPKSWRRRLSRVRVELIAGFIGYIRARVLLMSITAVMTIIGFSILGAPYAWLLGIACGILDILPLVGQSALILPWSLYHFIVGNYPFAVGLIVVLSVSSLVRQTAEARVMGKNLDLHPLTALISVYVGTKLFGAKGFIAGPLSVIFVKAMYHSFIVPMFPAEEEE